MNPQRIQLSRKKGYRKPDGAIVVSRPSKWGNQAILFTYARSGVVGLPQIVYPAGISLALGRPSDSFVVDPAGGRTEFFSDPRRARAFAVEWFRQVQAPRMDLSPLTGHDLACWCPLDGSPCHADVLLELANA